MDEHVPRAVTDGLRRRGVDVLTAQEAGLREADDEQQLAFASREGRVIFTQDADLLRLHAAGRPHHGIVYVPQQTTIGYVVRGLMLIYDILSSEDMIDHVEFL
jgi:predicted nuclease of predicted toxin-antitoxin system